MKKLLLSAVIAMAGVTVFAEDALQPSGTLPVLYINTEGLAPITSKEDYLTASYWLDPMGATGVEALGSEQSPLTMQIRGRGNYSWVGFDKKPYRLKLADKQPLLGMKKSKHFALLAHADDKVGFMRNIVGLQLSRLIGMPWTPADAPCEVMLNGEYIGLYFLTETIRVDKDRVNVTEQPDGETDPELVTGGWLVEIDNYDSDPHITLSENGVNMWITYKSPEVLSSEQLSYLQTQMSAINDKLYIEDLNDNSWEETVDTDVLARYYIVQELVDDYESFHGSCYINKNIGNDAKWKFGPVWDFGSAFSGTKSNFIYEGRQWHQHWIKQMCLHPAFYTQVTEIFSDFIDGADFPTIYRYINDYADRIAEAAARDAERWPDYGNADEASQALYVKGLLNGAVRWLGKQWLGEAPQQYFVIGSFDNWAILDPDGLMTRKADGVYSVTLAKLSKNFKINNGSWTDGVNIGSNGSMLEIGVPYEYKNSAGSQNIVISMAQEEITDVNVTLDTTAGTITVTDASGIESIGADSPAASEVWYNLQGMPVKAHDLPGIYIHGRRKVAVH